MKIASYFKKNAFGFEPRSCGVGNDRSFTVPYTTIAQDRPFLESFI